ncbi:MAG: ATP-dependent DNA helicase UvrD2 [Tetrasphaera sp.]
MTSAPPEDPDAILARLDPEQREVAAHPLGPMCILAGAGTGKTRAITHRIAFGVRSGAYAAPRVLALTFTARAAGEMRTRLRELGVVGVQARTFHAAALRQLHYFWPRAIGGAAPDVMPHKIAAVAEAAARLRLRFERPELRDLAAEIEWAKVSLVTAEAYPQAAARAQRIPPGVDATAMARLMAAYEEVKAARGVIDFEDVLLLTLGILRDRGDIAAAVREQYRHFVVDEYQDVNGLQQALLAAWLGDREEVCVVGDPAQTIYSFAGASAEHLRGFARAHPGCRQVTLARNYRSSPQILALANAVASMPGGARRWGGQPLIAQSEPGPDPATHVFPDDPAEAAGIAELIERLRDSGTPASQIAVLFRTNAQSEAIEAALAERGIPYLVRGGERFFARREVKQAIALLRGSARADDGSSALPELVRDVLTSAGWSREPPATSGAARERWESLDALAVLADQFAAATPAARLPELIRELDERAAAQHAPSVEGVTLASLHAAKGLEWDAVVIAGVSDGYLPIAMAELGAQIEEERRLFYVGLTRARRQLHLTWAQARSPGGRPTRRPSRFLDATVGGRGPATPAAGGAAAGKTARSRQPKVARCRTCAAPLLSAAERTTRRCGNCPATYDEATFAALRSWRAAIAKASGVPAYVVFTDATLTAIAEQTPSTDAEMIAIPGVGQRKLAMYGAHVRAVLAGEDPAEVAVREPAP